MAELSFCNLCDHSIPDSELRDGSASRVGDRALCGKCLALLVEVVEPPKSSAVPLLATLLALAALASCVMLLLRIDGLQGDLSAALDRLEMTRAADLQETGDDIQMVRRLLVEETSLFENQFELLRGGLQSQGVRIGEQVFQLDSAAMEVKQINAVQSDLLSRLSRVESTASVLEDRQRAQRSTQENLRDQLTRVGGQLDKLQAAAPTPDEDIFSGEVSALLRRLQGDDPEVRYDALEKLSGIQDPRLLPHIFPLLADPYEFTRFLAAHTLGDWEAKAAVPHLIEALLDEVKFVREAAVRSLRRITAQNLDYQHDGDDEQLRAGYQQWKTWWEANKEAFMAEL